jgi:hypothetical protein
LVVAAPLLVSISLLSVTLLPQSLCLGPSHGLLPQTPFDRESNISVFESTIDDLESCVVHTESCAPAIGSHDGG